MLTYTHCSAMMPSRCFAGVVGATLAALLSTAAAGQAAPNGAEQSGLARSRAPGEAILQSDARNGVVVWHRRLGTVALGTFGTALVIGAGSGNLGKLTDPAACCPDGGTRNSTWRAVDRTLVKVGIASYIGAAGLAAYRASHKASPVTSRKRTAHRWLALAHGLAFTTSAVTGSMMGRAQETDPAKFARVARVHVAANVAFVPLLAAAFTTMAAP